MKMLQPTRAVRVPAELVLAAVMGVVLSSSLLRADEADDQYAVAAGHYKQERWELAAKEFQTFLSKYPTHPEVKQSVFFLAEAFLQMGGHSEEAAANFRKYLQQDPDGRFARQALFRAGETALLAGKSDQAKTELEQFLSKYPDDKLNAHVLPYLGDIALEEKDIATAGGYFRRALNRFPQGKLQDDCRFGLAEVLEKQGDKDEAERLYVAVAAKTGNPLADDAQFRLGALQYSTGKYAQAVKTFDQFETTLSDSPRRPSARLGRGWALLKLERTDEAEGVFGSITSDPKVGLEAQYWLGLTQKARKDWAGATKTLLAVLKVDPKHKLAPAIHFHAGDALLRSGDHAAAGRQFEQVVASGAAAEQWADDAVRGLVQVALQTKDHQTVDKLAADFSTRFADSPLKTNVQRMLGQSLVQRKRYDRAVEVLEALVKADTPKQQDLDDRYLLTLAYEGLGRHEEALGVLLPVIDSATGGLKADAQLTKASLLIAMKRFEEAIAPLKAFLDTQPTGDPAVRGLGQLAICYARTGKFDDAKRSYAELLKKYPEHALIVPTTEQMGEAAFEAKDLYWATRLFQWLGTQTRQPEYQVKGLAGLGWSQFESGKLVEAEATFGQLLKKNPDTAITAEAALLRGRILQQLDKPDAALAMYDLVIERCPKTKQFPEALWAAARLRDELQQDKEAAALYERLAKDCSEFPEPDAVLYKWSWTLHDLDRQGESTALLERIHKEYPKSAFWTDAVFRLAQRAFGAKDYQRAAVLVTEVLGGKPSKEVRENAMYLRGQIATAEEKWEQAREAFEALVKDYPETSLRLMADFGVAESVFRDGDYKSAGERFDQLSRQTQGRQEPWLALVRLRLAQSLCHQKKWSEALAVATKIEGEYPDFKEQYEADYVVGRCLASQADLEGARGAYLKVIRSPEGKKTETAAKAQLMIGESYFHQKNYEAALREYLRLEILYEFPTWQASALLQAGKCHELLGEWKQATDLYARLLKVYPESSVAKEAGRRIRTARQQAAARSAS